MIIITTKFMPGKKRDRVRVWDNKDHKRFYPVTYTKLDRHAEAVFMFLHDVYGTSLRVAPKPRMVLPIIGFEDATKGSYGECNCPLPDRTGYIVVVKDMTVEDFVRQNEKNKSA